MKAENPELYVDSLGGVMLGYPVSKLTFITVVQNGHSESDSEPNDNTSVVKKDVVTLTIPTAALIDACQKILDNLQENKETLVLAQEKTAKHIESLLSKA